jgi:mannose-1-phosphate guanylyltransferase
VIELKGGFLLRVILLSGGVGARLWPLSNGHRSKVFLKLLPAPDGSTESMIQRIIRQLDSVGLLNSAIVITHHSQSDLISHHISDRIRVISEPCRRGTFNAVALSSVYLSDLMKAGPDETVCVLPVDLFVDDGFYEVIKRLPAILSESRSDLALLGVAPTHASEQYGYILPANTTNKDYYKIQKFVEKPKKATARTLIKKKALWNCGVFAFKLSFMLDVIKQKYLPTNFEHLCSLFEPLMESSFDQEVVERTLNAIVVPYHGCWDDLGSWESLTQQLPSNTIGPGSLSHGTSNTQLINELSIPVHVIGAKGMIVAASPNGVIVAAKKSSNEIKNVLSNLETEQGIMYEEKNWGSITVLDNRDGGDGLSTRTSKIKMFAGSQSQLAAQEGCQICIIILSGFAEFDAGDDHRSIRAGDMERLSVGIRYRIKSTTPLEYLKIEIGNFSPSNHA